MTMLHFTRLRVLKQLIVSDLIRVKKRTMTLPLQSFVTLYSLYILKSKGNRNMNNLNLIYSTKDRPRIVKN